jgi:O-succinylbenzoic acid--CoA ligase
MAGAAMSFSMAISADQLGSAEFWGSSENMLLLNPQLPSEAQALYKKVWQESLRGSYLNRPDAPGYIGLVTSGTSGEMGRLIFLAKTAFLVSAAGANQHLMSTSQDVWLRTLPVFHVGGLSIHARAHLSGATVVASSLVKWNATGFYNELVSSHATLLSLVPTQLFDLIQLALPSPQSLRAVVIGGARLQDELRTRALDLGWPILPSYGLTECGSQVATARAPGDPSLWPLPHILLRSVPASGAIEIKSQGLFSAQVKFQKSDAGEPLSSQFVIEDPKVDGWFRTEDRGHLASDGSLVVEGRSQDFVKIGGEGVNLILLEDQLARLCAQHRPDLANQIVLLAAQDERLGARIVLLSSADETATSRIKEEFSKSVMPFERPREIYYVAQIPRSALGKLLRVQALHLVGLQAVPHI